MKQVKEDPCRINLSTFQFWITTPPTTQALDVNPVEWFMDVLHTMSWTLKWTSVCKKYLHEIHKLQKMLLNKRKWFSTMSARRPCKLISNTKPNMVSKPMPWNSKNNSLCTFYSLKEITREVKFLSQTFDG